MDASPYQTFPGPSKNTICAELIGSDTAAALGITAKGTTPILDLCRQLVEAGSDPTSRLECYRGSVLCLTIRSVVEGSRVRVATHGSGFAPLHECTTAPLVSPPPKNDPKATDGLWRRKRGGAP